VWRTCARAASATSSNRKSSETGERLLLRTARRRKPSLLNILIQKFVRFPCRDVLVQHAVSVLRGQADWRVDFQNVGFVQALKFCPQRLPRCRTEIVFGMREHDSRIRIVDSSRQSFAQLRRAIPGTGGCGKCDRRMYSFIPFGSQQCYVSCPPKECPASAIR